jgi:hypothetical protein
MQQLNTKIRRYTMAALLALTMGLSLVTIAAPSVEQWAQQRHMKGLMAGSGVKPPGG